MHEFTNRHHWFLRLSWLQWYIFRIFVDLDSIKASENALKFSNFNKLSKHEQSLRHHIERWSSGPKQQKCDEYSTVLIINYINYEQFCCKLGSHQLEISEEKKPLSILSQRMPGYWHHHSSGVRGLIWSPQVSGEAFVRRAPRLCECHCCSLLRLCVKQEKEGIWKRTI